MDNVELENFVRTTKRLCALESKLISLHNKRISHIAKFMKLARSEKSEEAMKQVLLWTQAWEKIQQVHEEMTAIALSGAGDDTTTSVDDGCKFGGGNLVSGGGPASDIGTPKSN